MAPLGLVPTCEQQRCPKDITMCPLSMERRHIQPSGSPCHPVCCLGHLGSVEGPWDSEGFASRIWALGQRTQMLCPTPAVARREQSAERSTNFEP